MLVDERRRARRDRHDRRLGQIADYEKTGNYQIVEIAGLYWHFVDLVWVFIFAFFYLW